MIDDGRTLTLLGLLGIAGAAAVRGSRGVIRRGPASASFDVEAMLERLLVLEVPPERQMFGWIAFDPEHELPCNLFHVWHGKLGEPWWHTFHAAPVSKIDKYRYQFTLDGEEFIGVLSGHITLQPADHEARVAFRDAITTCHEAQQSRAKAGAPT